MKKNQIKVGGTYTAKVSGKLTTVRVDAIRVRAGHRVDRYSGRSGTKETTVYDVTNLATNRKTTFASAMKFRGVARATQSTYGAALALNNPPKLAFNEKLKEQQEAAKQPADPTASDQKPSKTTSAMKQQPTSSTTSPFTPTNLTVPPTSLSSRIKQEQVGTGQEIAPHLIIEARAGTGKSTTLLCGVMLLCDLQPKITPSPQQQAVWDAMLQSKGQLRSIHMVAFNKAIASHLEAKLKELGCPSWVTASTMHGMGFKAVLRQFKGCRVNSYRVQDIISELLEQDIRDLRKSKLEVIRAVEELVGLCKMNLVGFHFGQSNTTGAPWESACWCAALSDLASYYDVDLNGHSQEVFDLVPRVLERCKDVGRDNCIDFNDMIWLPVVLGLPTWQYNMLLVDEAQDLNKCQQALARKCGKRLVFCGDPKQAIYGFAGADAESMIRLERELGETNQGVVHLPLTVTRRCGKAIVAEAQKIVPDFEAHESNPDGLVGMAIFKDSTNPQHYSRLIQNGDMVLCRCNAPLVSECFKFIRAGRKANIQGRDVGQGLVKTVQKLCTPLEPKAVSITTLIQALTDWLYKELSKEQAKRNPSDSRLINLQDRHDCLLCFTEGARTADDMITKINTIFTDSAQGGILLSSVHKAKGLEADRVFIINTKEASMPHPMAKTPWEKQQEQHILYVARTRAIRELVYVT